LRANTEKLPCSGQFNSIPQSEGRITASPGENNKTGNISGSRQGFRIANSLPFNQRANVVRRYILELLDQAAGPLNFHGIQV
jgi:hypothetical protein